MADAMHSRAASNHDLIDQKQAANACRIYCTVVALCL